MKTTCVLHYVTQLLNPQNNDFQTEKITRQIHRNVGLTENTAVTFADVSKFEKHLKCKIIIIHRSDNKASYSFFQTSKTPHEKTIYLFLHDNHYYGVKSITGLLGCSYVCRFCHSGYEKARGHKCEFSCNICRDVDCYKHRQSIIKCPDCSRLCKSKRCFDIHKVKHRSERGEYSLCETGFYCNICNVIEYRNPFNRKDHVCLERHCELCGEKVDSETVHNCFIQRLRKEKPNMKYIFYDFETRQETGTHTTNLLCCMNCCGMSWVFEGEECVAAFFRTFPHKKYRGYTFTAQNARGFDSYLLLNHLVKEGIAPEIITQGGKILCFSDTDFRQKYIDSLSFLPMKLSNLPKAMGFSENKKGYFPHFWNTLEHRDYIGPYPETEFYGVDSMMPKDFFMWYVTVTDKVFNLKKEMHEYCMNDVDILRQGCLAFRNEILKSTEVDPFKCITIASVCMKIFRTLFLDEDTLAIPPLDNYINRQKSFSTPSIQWLEYISTTQNLPIQHALNEGEAMFGLYSVDGYCEVGQTRKAFEFLGCFYHGCEKCYPSMAPFPFNINISFRDVR
ncbi:uncharacterized protein LOC131357401 [Hemibagrus wyckioides]|uniref:uncharacterized protein LOC131357401 n=1 Tax=Hemibagrus wyckioides TaxID=337641 RepID=UPI00266D006C|nr:uncharacterized protein LOC131357401 [Hemibagrus wyckioides]